MGRRRTGWSSPSVIAMASRGRRTNQPLRSLLPRRAAAAFSAAADRCSGVSFSARALPPFNPPRRPIGGVTEVRCGKTHAPAVSVPADQIRVGAAQGHRRRHARPIRVIRRLSVTFFGATTLQLEQHKPQQTWHSEVLLERERVRLGEGSSRDLSMCNGPTKTFDIAHQFYFSWLT